MKTKRITQVFVLFLAVILLAGCGQKKTVLKYKRDLSVLTMREGISGRFFLASGSFGSDFMYVFVEAGDDGMSAVKTVSINEAVYTEDIIEGGTPFVELYDCTLGDESITYCSNIAGVPEVIRDASLVYSYFVFHIPQGSIATTFDLGFTPPPTQP